MADVFRTKPAQRIEAALLRVSAEVFDDCCAHAEEQNLGNTATFDGLVAYLKATYESQCNAYIASNTLRSLHFQTGDDMTAFNREFLRLLGIAELEEGGFSLSTSIAKETAMRRWDTLRTLATVERAATELGGPEPMDVDRVQQRDGSQSDGLQRDRPQRSGI
ncbi:hypothetical protein H4R19_001354, partial [Coemansia spiralis]